MKEFTIKTETIKESDFTEREKQIYQFGIQEGYKIGYTEDKNDRSHAALSVFMAIVLAGMMIAAALI